MRMSAARCLNVPAMNESARTTPVYVISVAADLAGMHPQTLRTYDRLGLVRPRRTVGGGRRYSQHDIELLVRIQRLSQEEGINLSGIRRILDLEREVEMLASERDALLRALADASTDAGRREAEVRAEYRRDLVPVARPGAVVLYRRPRRH
jgi:MerR family transcriptional regulator, heat shock protein HspR